MKNIKTNILLSSFTIGILLSGCTSGGRLSIYPKSETQPENQKTTVANPDLKNPGPTLPPGPITPPAPGPSASPVPPAPPAPKDPQIILAAGQSHTCASVNGAAYCWGDNEEGLLGVGGGSSKLDVPTPVLGLASGVKSLSAGGYRTCATRIDGAVLCWGVNVFDSGKPGYKTLVYSPVYPGELQTMTQISEGQKKGCGIINGNVFCWDISNNPKRVPTEEPATQVAVGSGHMCFLSVSGRVYCWGDNSNGQLGDGSTDDQFFPTLVQFLPGKAVEIRAAHLFTCAILEDGTVHCWGMNSTGQLGSADWKDKYMPSQVVGIDQPVSAISLGLFSACAKTVKNEVYCWGSNNFGQLGDGTKEDRNIPVRVGGISGEVTQITMGSFHACAATKQGQFYCWGDNTDGQLGIGSSEEKLVPALLKKFW